ncbi:MAG: hypothetical protein H0W75_02030 [Chitinophagaceae bacterium]|nr:hypothetical protein [Chitinophagaceae bacterium]
MNKANRDLLVLFKEELMSPQSLEHEVEMLHELLYDVEKIENLVIAHEVINLNSYKIQNKIHIIRDTIRKKELKPFVFLSNKN